MTLFQIFEQYWGVLFFVPMIVIFFLPSVNDDDFFNLDENSTDEEKELLEKRNALVEKRNTLVEMSIYEYREKAENKGGFPESTEELNDVTRELLEEYKNEAIRQLRSEIDQVTKAFIEVKKPRIYAEKLNEANELEAKARELKMNPNHEAQKEANSLLKKVKKLRKMYS